MAANIAETTMSHSVIWERYGDRAIGGDRSAIGGLLETYRPLLMVIANRSMSASLKTKVAASDLVQQTCEDAFVGIMNVRAQNGSQFWDGFQAFSQRMSATSSAAMWSARSEPCAGKYKSATGQDSIRALRFR